MAILYYSVQKPPVVISLLLTSETLFTSNNKLFPIRQNVWHKHAAYWSGPRQKVKIHWIARVFKLYSVHFNWGKERFAITSLHVVQLYSPSDVRSKRSEFGVSSLHQFIKYIVKANNWIIYFKNIFNYYCNLIWFRFRIHFKFWSPVPTGFLKMIVPINLCNTTGLRTISGQHFLKMQVFSTWNPITNARKIKFFLALSNYEEQVALCN